MTAPTIVPITAATGSNDGTKQISVTAWNAGSSMGVSGPCVVGKSTAGAGAAVELNPIPAALLATSGASAGTYGDATHIPQIAVDTYGRITSVSNVVAAGGGGGSGIIVQTYIAGMVITKNATNANHIDISAGEAWVPAAAAVVAYAGGTDLNPGTLVANTVCQVYLNAAGAIVYALGTAGPTNADPPSTCYMGSARKDGSDRRWIGSFMVDSSGNVMPWTVTQYGGSVLKYVGDSIPYASRRVLNTASPATAFADLSFAGYVPRYAVPEVDLYVILSFSTSGFLPYQAFFSLDDTSYVATAGTPYLPTGFLFHGNCFGVPIIPSTPKLRYFVDYGGGGTHSMVVDLRGFTMPR